MANAKVKVDVNFKSIQKKIAPANRTKARVILSNQMLIDMTPFVPMNDGDLRASGHVTGNGETLEWSELYARAQFFGSNGIVTFRNYHTPGTGARWDEKASAGSMEKWKRVYLRGLAL